MLWDFGNGTKCIWMRVEAVQFLMLQAEMYQVQSKCNFCSRHVYRYFKFQVSDFTMCLRFLPSRCIHTLSFHSKWGALYKWRGVICFNNAAQVHCVKCFFRLSCDRRLLASDVSEYQEILIQRILWIALQILLPFLKQHVHSPLALNHIHTRSHFMQYSWRFVWGLFFK